MTDNIQPLALMLADRLHHEQPTVLRIDAERAGEELRRQHARIAELEAQLSSSGFTAADMASASAQGFRDGVVSASVNSDGSITSGTWAHLKLMMEESAWGGEIQLSDALANVDEFAAAHPSPPEGMVGGWISVKERLPPPFEEVVVYPRPDDYCCEAFCDTAGNWKWAEYEHNFGVHHRGCQVEYWLMLPEVPAPPTTSAGSGKGE